MPFPKSGISSKIAARDSPRGVEYNEITVATQPATPDSCEATVDEFREGAGAVGVAEDGISRKVSQRR